MATGIERPPIVLMYSRSTRSGGDLLGAEGSGEPPSVATFHVDTS
jgi:hypothetical protein